MAEVAPINSAHAHARKAAEQLQHVHFAQAAEEHEQASTDFSRAAKGTSDFEALRVLKLLEEQHQKLARIVKTQDAPQLNVVTEEPHTLQLQPSTRDEPASIAAPPKVASPKPRSTTAALAAARAGSQVRESSPSLARDIASRRGIPQNTRIPAASQSGARQLSPGSRRRAHDSSALKIPPSIFDSQASLTEDAISTKKAEYDEGFTKFYSNLTSGTMSKLSSVLAYAGLPLTADEISPQSSGKQKLEKPTVAATNDPDVKNIFSKAALDAIEDEHRQRGTLGHGFGPAESFYVVQKGGGTYSYADIARAQRAQQQQNLSDLAEDEETEFVDAKEIPGPSSPQRSGLAQQRRESFGSTRTQEELELENTTLKTTLEQVAKRLVAFEAHAQDASMAALTQSMVNLRPPQGANVSDPAMHERLRQLERQLEQQAEDRQKLESLAGRQEKMLKKYHSKWEELKRGAKEKDRVKREKSEKDVVATSVADPPEAD